MELLAPAGAVESFRAAVNAGADAVYLGLTDFNARLRAKNFTMKTLSYAVPYAHERNVKVYVTLNTLVKQMELERALHFLYQLEQIGIDAIIVQDVGVITVAAATFPRLRLHASTQMSVHNSAGVETCRRLGIRRAVAARELTLEEIGKLCSAGTVEIEVFAHGALCYSLSGMCLASSFFGGSSGNRGRCTQVCRRAFDVSPRVEGAAPEYFFSPNDLSAVDMLPQLAAAGVRSLKIEGRMKGAEYVRTAVAAYRMALDDPSRIQEARGLLRHDMGRRKTALFLNGIVQESIIDAKNPAGTGVYVGTAASVDGREMAVAGEETVHAGDILRVQPRSGDEGIMARVVKASVQHHTLCLVLDKEVACHAGDAVYCVGRGGVGGREERFNVRPARYAELFPDARRALRNSEPKAPRDPNRDRRLFFKIDSPQWLPLLARPDVGGVMCGFDKNDMQRFVLDGPQRERLGRAAYIEPPPFVGETELGEWRRLIQTLCVDGQCGLVCQNLGHIALAQKATRLRGDYLLWCTNRASQAAYASLGLTHFSYSLEDDSMNIRDCRSQNGMAYLFTHVPLFVSRMKPAVPPGSHLTDRLGRKTLTAEKHGLYYLIAEETVSLFHKRRKLEDLGIITFCVDLSFMDPDEKVLNEILDCYANEKKFPESCLFNFKGGLK